MSGFAVALLKFLPTLIGMISNFISWAHDRRLIEAGQSKAIAEAMEAAQAAAQAADKIRREAAQAHANDKTDNAFLPDGFRD